MIERMLNEKTLPTSNAPKSLDTLVYSKIKFGNKASLLSRISLTKAKVYIFAIILVLIWLSIFVYITNSKDFDTWVWQVAQTQIDSTLEDIDDALNIVGEENNLDY